MILTGPFQLGKFYDSNKQMITGDLTCMFAPVLVFTLGICCWWDLDNTGHLGQSASPPLSCQWKGTSSKSCDQLNKGENNGVLQLFIFFSQTSLHSLKYQAFSSSVNSSANAGTCCCNAHRMKNTSAASALLERQRESLISGQLVPAPDQLYL